MYIRYFTLAFLVCHLECARLNINAEFTIALQMPDEEEQRIFGQLRTQKTRSHTTPNAPAAYSLRTRRSTLNYANRKIVTSKEVITAVFRNKNKRVTKGKTSRPHIKLPVNLERRFQPNISKVLIYQPIILRNVRIEPVISSNVRAKANDRLDHEPNQDYVEKLINLPPSSKLSAASPNQHQLRPIVSKILRLLPSVMRDLKIKQNHTKLYPISDSETAKYEHSHNNSSKHGILLVFTSNENDMTSQETVLNQPKPSNNKNTAPKERGKDIIWSDDEHLVPGKSHDDHIDKKDVKNIFTSPELLEPYKHMHKKHQAPSRELEPNYRGILKTSSSAEKTENKQPRIIPHRYHTDVLNKKHNHNTMETEKPGKGTILLKTGNRDEISFPRNSMKSSTYYDNEPDQYNKITVTSDYGKHGKLILNRFKIVTAESSDETTATRRETYDRTDSSRDIKLSNRFKIVTTDASYEKPAPSRKQHETVSSNERTGPYDANIARITSSYERTTRSRSSILTTKSYERYQQNPTQTPQYDRDVTNNYERETNKPFYEINRTTKPAGDARMFTGTDNKQSLSTVCSDELRIMIEEKYETASNATEEPLTYMPVHCRYGYPQIRVIKTIINYMINELARICLVSYDFIKNEKPAFGLNKRFNVISRRESYFFEDMYVNMLTEQAKYSQKMREEIRHLPKDPCKSQAAVKDIWTRLLHKSVVEVKKGAIKCTSEYLKGQGLKGNDEFKKKVSRVLAGEMNRIETAQLHSLCDELQVCYHEYEFESMRSDDDSSL